jgi:hypothetical protein
VGAFVAAILDLERWSESSGMAGDVKTYNEVIKLAESIRGRYSFLELARSLAHRTPRPKIRGEVPH